MSSITQWSFIPFPRDHTIKYTVTIDGTDVTSDVIGLKVVRAATTEVHNARIIIENSNNAYSYTGNEDVKIQFDFSDGDTDVFNGVIEKVKSNHRGGHQYELICRHDCAIWLDTLVNNEYTNQTPEAVVTDLLSTYASSYSLNWGSTLSSEAITIAWSNKTLWEALNDIASIVNADFYLDESSTLQFFERGTVLNQIECVVEGDNFIESDGIGDDITEVKNQIKVSGEDPDGLPILYTGTDSTSQTTYGVREKSVEDSDISDMNTAKDLGDAEISVSNITQKKGTVTSFLLPDLNPGEQMWVSVPTQLIHQKFTINKIEHDVISDETICTVEKLQTMPLFFRDRVKKEKSLEQVKNINNMKESYNFTFDDSSNITSQTATTVSGGKLVLSGASTGIMSTDIKNIGFTATQYEFRLIGEDLAQSEVRVSLNSGGDFSNWQNIETNKNTVFTAPAGGNAIKFEIRLKSDTNNPNPKLDAFTLMFK